MAPKPGDRGGGVDRCERHCPDGRGGGGDPPGWFPVVLPSSARGQVILNGCQKVRSRGPRADKTVKCRNTKLWCLGRPWCKTDGTISELVVGRCLRTGCCCCHPTGPSGMNTEPRCPRLSGVVTHRLGWGKNGVGGRIYR